MKPLRAFPFALNVGTDICQISRIYGILNGPRRARFVDRILAPEERAQRDPRRDLPGLDGDSTAAPKAAAAAAAARRDNGEVAVRDTPLWKAAAFLAGRFAAKEAAIKAHSHRRLTFHDVVIERRGGAGGPRLGSGPPVARIRAGEGEGEGEDGSALVSISHDGDYATAVCVAHDPGVAQEAGVARVGDASDAGASDAGVAQR
ncbi:hypothetical protein TOPH_07443 [Tolypocladium ophioglossoides CBS 100239]|uniref:Uncharacterized protein n=1 Tax=Tolypocladium ophioglossoides (strain CBS 100239) TaxID=1163406 RepID=A0A0L0N180_TOLOC|nr:hypothetical protein TOPH_07443 [Tolypocladium ophioglossoides CBS 100239]